MGVMGWSEVTENFLLKIKKGWTQATLQIYQQMIPTILTPFHSSLRSTPSTFRPPHLPPLQPLFQTLGMFVGMCAALIIHAAVLIFKIPFPGYKHKKSSSRRNGYAAVGEVGEEEEDEVSEGGQEEGRRRAGGGQEEGRRSETTTTHWEPSSSSHD